MPDEPIIESSGNVFADSDFSPEEATLLAMRAELMAELRETIARNGWTPAQAAGRLGIESAQVSALMHGQYDPFSLDLLIALATRAGRRVELAVL